MSVFFKKKFAIRGLSSTAAAIDLYLRPDLSSAPSKSLGLGPTLLGVDLIILSNILECRVIKRSCYQSLIDIDSHFPPVFQFNHIKSFLFVVLTTHRFCCSSSADPVIVPLSVLHGMYICMFRI
jgi:hypothetical protein